MDVPSNLSNNPNIDGIGRTVAEVVESSRDNLNQSFSRTKDRYDSIQNETLSVAGGGQITDEQLDAISKKLEDIHGLDISSEYSN